MMIGKILKRLYKGHLSGGEDVLLTFHTSFNGFINQRKKTIFFGLLSPLVLFLVLYPKYFLFWLAWLLLGFLRLVYLYYTWLRDVWVLTNLGLVHVKWNGPYKLTTRRVEFPDIDEVGIDKQGIVQHFSKLGNIQIALLNGNGIIFEGQTNPNMKVKILLDVRREFLRQQKWGDEDTLKDLLVQIVAKHMRDGGMPFKGEKTKYEDDVVIEVIQKEKWKVD